MSRLENVPIDQLKPNPFRNLATYPWIEEKIETLLRSYAEIGVFEGIIARPAKDGGYEKWFGHHRHEAAQRAGISHLPIIIRDATDEQMIKAMAHENSEDYSTDFLVQLNTWDGGIQYLTESSHPSAKKLEALEIARLLGMTREDEKGKYGDRLGIIAEACNAAHTLISAGHLNRSDLRGLNITAARELTQAVLSQMERIDKLANMSKTPAKSVDRAKGFVAKAGKTTAERTRRGEVSTKAIRTEVNANAFTNAAKAHKTNAPLPLLNAFADALCRSLSKLLVEDYAAEKLGQIAKAVGQIALEADHAAVRRVQFELEELAKRSNVWVKRITPTREKVVALKQLEGRS